MRASSSWLQLNACGALSHPAAVLDAMGGSFASVCARQEVPPVHDWVGSLLSIQVTVAARAHQGVPSVSNRKTHVVKERNPLAKSGNYEWDEVKE